HLGAPGALQLQGGGGGLALQVAPEVDLPDVGLEADAGGADRQVVAAARAERHHRRRQRRGRLARSPPQGVATPFFLRLDSQRINSASAATATRPPAARCQRPTKAVMRSAFPPSATPA